MLIHLVAFLPTNLLWLEKNKFQHGRSQCFSWNKEIWNASISSELSFNRVMMWNAEKLSKGSTTKGRYVFEIEK